MAEGAGALLAAGAEVRLAMVAGLVSLGVACALLVVAAAVRASRLRRARAHEAARRRWMPVFLAAVTGRARVLPPAMPRRQREPALEVWNQLMVALRGDARRRLRRCGAGLGFADHARRLTGRRRGRGRLDAVVALGHLGDRASWGRLVSLLDDRNSGVRLDAARALMRIDEADAVALLVPRLLDADHWYASAAVAVLAEARPEPVSLALAGAVEAAGPPARRQLARVLGGLRSPAALGPVRRLLHDAGDDHELLAACLDALAACGERADADRVRGLLGHPAWFVRLKAVTALGKLGSAPDLDRLSALLCDPEWWVRYRSAHALAAVPGLGPDCLRRLRSDHADPFARDAVAQVLAELEAAA